MARWLQLVKIVDENVNQVLRHRWAENNIQLRRVLYHPQLPDVEVRLQGLITDQYTQG